MHTLYVDFQIIQCKRLVVFVLLCKASAWECYKNRNRGDGEHKEDFVAFP